MSASRKWPLAALALAVLALGGWAWKGRALGLSLHGQRADSLIFADSAHHACGNRGSDKEACYEAILLPLVQSHGVRTAMGALNRLGQLDTWVRDEGHVLAHGIGITAGKLGGTNMGQTFASCTEIFQSGCYHGVIQAYFENLHHIDTTAVNNLCEPYTHNESDRWLRFQCVHGMGHGVTMFYAHDLPQGLQACDLLRDSWDRESCYGGAFMENIVNATNPHHVATRLVHLTADSSAGNMAGMAGMDHGGHDMAGMDHHSAFKAMDSTDLQYPCSILGAQYQDACYMMQTSVMLHFTNGDMARTAQACLQAPQRMRYTCHQSLGRDINSYAHQDHAEAIRMCAVSDDEYEPWCHIGVVKNLIDLTAKSEDGMSYCRDISGNRNKLSCYHAVGEQIAALKASSSDRTQACSTAESRYREACLYGAQVSTRKPSDLPEPRG